KIAWPYYLKNPLIKRAAEVSRADVCAWGCGCRAEDRASQTGSGAFLQEHAAEMGRIGMTVRDQTLRCDHNVLVRPFHRPAGRSGSLPRWLFGCPDIYAALDCAKRYKKYLEDWCTINTALARFVWDAKTKAGEQTIQALQTVLNTTIASGDDNLRDFVDRNPPP